MRAAKQPQKPQDQGAPDFRTLSHWETKRKLPSVRLLRGYLVSMGGFCDLQEALDQVEGRVPKRVRDGMEELRQRVEVLERRLDQEARSATVGPEAQLEPPQPTAAEADSAEA